MGAVKLFFNFASWYIYTMNKNHIQKSKWTGHFACLFKIKSYKYNYHSLGSSLCSKREDSFHSGSMISYYSTFSGKEEYEIIFKGKALKSNV